MPAASIPDRDSGKPPDEAAVFALLGDCYLEPPTEAGLETIRTWAARLSDMDPSPDVSSALEPLAVVTPGDARRLNEGFTRLFRGVVPDAPDPPYESLYRDGQLQGPSAEAVRTAYLDAGVTLAGSTGELVDHLGVELHFAGTLVERGEDEALSRFVSSHPGVWFPAFREAIEARDPPDFYRGLLAMTTLVLESTTEPDNSLVADGFDPTNPPDRLDSRPRDRSHTDSRSELDQ